MWEDLLGLEKHKLFGIDFPFPFKTGEIFKPGSQKRLVEGLLLKTAADIMTERQKES